MVERGRGGRRRSGPARTLVAAGTMGTPVPWMILACENFLLLLSSEGLRKALRLVYHPQYVLARQLCAISNTPPALQ